MVPQVSPPVLCQVHDIQPVCAGVAFELEGTLYQPSADRTVDHLFRAQVALSCRRYYGRGYRQHVGRADGSGGVQDMGYVKPGDAFGV